MANEHLRDVLERLADRAEVYGVCLTTAQGATPDKGCRHCFVETLEDDVRAAMALERRCHGDSSDSAGKLKQLHAGLDGLGVAREVDGDPCSA